MKVNQKLVVMALAVFTVVACGKKTVPPPAPQPAPPVVVPDRPAPAPAPTRTVVPEVSEYDQIRSKSIDEIDRMGLLGDIYYDYDEASLREADRATLERNGETMKKYDFLVVTIEGHADERGTIEYNLALSDRRARLVYDYLMSIGIDGSRIKAVAYGKEIPVCTESNEDCWQRNRRAHLAVTGKVAR